MERSAHMTEGPHGGQDSRNGNQDPPEDTTPAEGNIYDRKSVIEGGQGSAEGQRAAGPGRGLAKHGPETPCPAVRGHFS